MKAKKVFYIAFIIADLYLTAYIGNFYLKEWWSTPTLITSTLTAIIFVADLTTDFLLPEDRYK